MKIGDFEIRVWEDFARDGFQCYIIERNYDGKIKSVATQIVMEEVEEGDFFEPQAPLFLRREQAGFLMDMLWRAGVRPAEISDSSGELAATKYHLEDMRKLAGMES